MCVCVSISPHCVSDIFIVLSSRGGSKRSSRLEPKDKKVPLQFISECPYNTPPSVPSFLLRTFAYLQIHTHSFTLLLCAHLPPDSDQTEDENKTEDGRNTLGPWTLNLFASWFEQALSFPSYRLHSLAIAGAISAFLPAPFRPTLFFFSCSFNYL